MKEQEQFPETIEFGGEVWKRTRLGEGEKGGMLVDYEIEGEGARRVHRYDDGRWLGSRRLWFGTVPVPRALDQDPYDIFDTQAEAMRYVLDLTPDAAIAEVIEWLVTNRHLEGSNAVQAGIAAGRKQVFAEIENLKTAA